MNPKEMIAVDDQIVINYLLPRAPRLDADTQTARKLQSDKQKQVLVEMFVYFAENYPGLVISNEAVCKGLRIEKQYYKNKLVHVRRTIEAVHKMVFHNLRSKGYCVAVGDQSKLELLKCQLRSLSHAFSAFRIKSLGAVQLGDDKVSQLINLLSPAFAHLLSIYESLDEDEREFISDLFKSEVGLPDFINEDAILGVFKRNLDNEPTLDH